MPNIFVNTKDGAIIFHCFEREDRIGLAAISVLYLLGVDMETVRQDYLFLNLVLGRYQAVMSRKVIDEGGGMILRINVRGSASVANEYLDAVFLLIDGEYDSLDDYIKNILKIGDRSIQNLRELHLGPKKVSER